MRQFGGSVLFPYVWRSPPPWAGRYPLGVPFARPKGTKTRLGRSPLGTPPGYGAGRASSWFSARFVWLWFLLLPPAQATLGSWPYGCVVPSSGPTLVERRFRRREPGHRQLGTAATPGRGPGGRSTICQRSRHDPQNFCTIYVTPPGQGPTIEERRPSLVPQGGP